MTNEVATAYTVVVQQALRTQVYGNRSTLSPLKLKQIGVTLTDLLLAPTPATAEQLQLFWERGLGFASFLAAITALHGALVAAEESAIAYMVFDQLATILPIYHEFELVAVRREQEALRVAVSEALNNQREQSSRLASLLQEVSTPVMPIYDGVLVLPLIGAIDTMRSTQITERLLNDIGQFRAHSVIIDITGVPVVDTSVAQHLLQTAQAAQLLGAAVILVGISPEIAQTMVQLGINIGNLTTLSNLQAGIAHALKGKGLVIRRSETLGVRG